MKKAVIAEVVSNETSFVEEKINQHRSNIKVVAKMVLKEPNGTEYTFNKTSGANYLKKAGDKLLIIKDNDKKRIYFHDSDEKYIAETKEMTFMKRFNNLHVNWFIAAFPVSILSLICSGIIFRNPTHLVLGTLFPIFTLLITSLVYTYKKSGKYSVDEEGRKIILDYINSEKNEDGSVKLSEVEKDILVEKEEYLIAR